MSKSYRKDLRDMGITESGIEMCNELAEFIDAWLTKHRRPDWNGGDTVSLLRRVSIAVVTRHPWTLQYKSTFAEGKKRIRRIKDGRS